MGSDVQSSQGSSLYVEANSAGTDRFAHWPGGASCRMLSSVDSGVPGALTMLPVYQLAGRRDEFGGSPALFDPIFNAVQEGTGVPLIDYNERCVWCPTYSRHLACYHASEHDSLEAHQRFSTLFLNAMQEGMGSRRRGGPV